MNRDDIFARTTRNRRALADQLSTLDATQWSTETLCAGWTVRHLAGHLLQPMLVGFGRFFLTSLRFRGDTAATVDHLARRLARFQPDELVQLLREHAADQVDPPRVGPMGPFAETCLHWRDIARPLSLSSGPPQEDWLDLLDYLTGPAPAPALIDPRTIEGVALRATDTHWHHGSGPEAAGPLEALAMAVTGRGTALHDLTGPGADLLRTRAARGVRQAKDG